MWDISEQMSCSLITSQGKDLQFITAFSLEKVLVYGFFCFTARIILIGLVFWVLITGNNALLIHKNTQNCNYIVQISVHVSAITRL